MLVQDQHQFFTLDKSDARFADYISGRFSKDHRALPVKTLAVGTPQERVTFQVVPLSNVSRPFKLVSIFLSLRPLYLTLTLGPVAVCASFFMWQQKPVNPVVFILATISLLFLHFAVFLFNDFYDHVSGQDRTNPRRGSQIIQRGWEPAFRIRQWAYVNLALGVLFGLALVAQTSVVLLGIGLVAAVAILGFERLRHLKSGPFSELLVFICFGPLLVAGLSTALGFSLEVSVLLSGCSLGALAVVSLHLKQLENIFYDSQLGSSHLITRLGLDKSRRLLLTEIVVVNLWLFYWLQGLSLGWTVFLVGVLPSSYLIYRVYHVDSPMSSSVHGLTNLGLSWHLGLCVLMSSYFLLQ